MKTISPELQAHLDGQLTNLATLWRIIRTDNTEFFFTDHNQNITFEGNIYQASSGYNRSAIDNKSGFPVDNLNVFGFFDNEAITEQDLRAGLFDFAEVRISTVNYTDLSQGAMKLKRGKLGEVIYSQSTGVFNTELRGLTQLYSQRAVELYQSQCRADLGDSQCKVPIRPALRTGATVYAVGDTVRWPQNPIVNLSVVNASFETDPVGSTTITGWTNVTNNVIVRAGSTGFVNAAKDGTQYIQASTGNSATTILEQNVSLSSFATTDIDNGLLFPYLEGWRAKTNPSSNATLQFDLVFKNASGDIISTWSSDSSVPIGDDIGEWGDVRIQMLGTDGFPEPFPNGSRSVDIRIVFENSRFNPPAVADFIELKVIDTTATNGSFIYADVYFECTNPGISSQRLPEWNTTVGAVTSEDGLNSNVQWTTQASFTFVAEIATVSSNGEFSFTALPDSRATVDDWFKYGAVTFTSGANKGLSMEIKGWVFDTLTITLFLNMPFNVSIGDQLELYAGCDKQITTCINKFNNVLNYRGEPYVPGQDELFNYPDARG